MKRAWSLRRAFLQSAALPGKPGLYLHIPRFPCIISKISLARSVVPLYG
jgi:hypothetical protein